MYSTQSLLQFDRLSKTEEKIKTNLYKQDFVKAHKRKRYQYIYNGVCSNCKELFERHSYGTKFPKYCLDCAMLYPSQRKKYSR